MREGAARGLFEELSTFPALPLTSHVSLLARKSDLVEHVRGGVAVDQEAVHETGLEDSLSWSQFAASAAKQDHFMFSQRLQIDR